MEGQQPGSGEAGLRRRQRRPVSAPRSRIPAHRPPAGEAAEPADHHGEPDQEIRNPPPPLRHSGRYSRAFPDAFWAFHTSVLTRDHERKTILMDIFGPLTSSLFGQMEVFFDLLQGQRSSGLTLAVVRPTSLRWAPESTRNASTAAI